MKCLNLSLLLFLTFTQKWVLSLRIRENIYTPLKGSSYCFKRANGTNEMGCSSDVNGNVGVVHLVEAEQDVKWLIEKGPHEPYIAVLTPKMFSLSSLVQLRTSGKVNGIVLIQSQDLELPESYSDDNECPNQPSSLYKDPEKDGRAFCSSSGNSPWNPAGNDILNENWPFPIFQVEDSDTVNFLLKDCFETFNKPGPGVDDVRDWPLCAMELESHMFLAVDTPTCLRRNDLVNPFSPTLVCDRLGDQNVFLLVKPEPLGSAKTFYGPKSVIVATTKLDAVNIFDGAEFGADSPVTGIVTLLSAASILSKNLQSENFQPGVENVLFAFFNGEAFDYIGSSRFMYDVIQKTFPANTSDTLKTADISGDEVTRQQWPLIKQESIRFVVEVGQASNHNGYTAHVDTKYPSSDRNLLEQMKSVASKFSISLKPSSAPDKGLPPASLQAILKEDRNIPGIVLSNFDSQFSNKYYHSVYDSNDSLKYDYEGGEDQKLVKDLADLSSFMAAYLFEAATGNTLKPNDSNFKANRTLINEILHCYLQSASCKMFFYASTPNTPPQNGGTPPSNKPHAQYVGVDRHLNYHAIMTQRLLAFLTGTPVPGDFTKDTCVKPENQDVVNYFYFRGYSTDNETCLTKPDCDGVCTSSTAWLAEAKSPAFLVDDYDFKDAKYSAWTESVWKTTSGRIFLKASPVLDGGFFALGVIIFIISFALVFWVNRHAGVIFEAGSSNTGSRTSDEHGLVEPAQL